MLINSKSAKASTSLWNQANSLAREAQSIADGLLKGTVDRHRIAVLAKGYAELYTDLRKNEK